jgi:hypothetical protein
VWWNLNLRKAAIKNSDFKRTTVRVNVNTKLKEWFRTGANIRVYLY